jgi:hypothetical protein
MPNAIEVRNLVKTYESGAAFSVRSTVSTSTLLPAN